MRVNRIERMTPLYNSLHKRPYYKEEDSKKKRRRNFRTNKRPMLK